MGMTLTRQICEICGIGLPDDPFQNCVCVSRQYPEFWLNEGDIYFRLGSYYITVAGEMKIVVPDPDDPRHNVIVRDTNDLLAFGITTDKEFDDACNDEENFYLDYSPWFEVVNESTGTYSDPIYELDAAVKTVLRLYEEEQKGTK